MKGQRLFGIGNLVENRQRIGSRLLGCLGRGTTLEATPNKHTDREHEARKDRAADEEKKDLATIETAAALRLGCCRDGAIVRTRFERNGNDSSFAVAVHAGFSYPQRGTRRKFCGALA